MSKTSWMIAPIALLLSAFAATARAQEEYSVEKIASAEEAEGVSDEIAKLIAGDGVRIKRGSSRTVCELWLCKELTTEADFEKSPVRLYPFQPGQLMGLLHFPRRGSEFRDQDVSSGWYTLRFGLQPIDGNHVGTSPTRDFLMLVAAENDDLPENWDADALAEASAEAAGSSHPAMLCLQHPGDAAEPSLRHDEANDWWVLHLLANTVADQKSKLVPLDIVVVGHAAE
jgi:hypothetical protein